MAQWLKSVGDSVDKYEDFVEVSTDKVNAGVPSPVTGTIRELLVKEGETVATGTPIAVIDEVGAATTAAPAASTVPAAPTAPLVRYRRPRNSRHPRPRPMVRPRPLPPPYRNSSSKARCGARRPQFDDWPANIASTSARSRGAARTVALPPTTYLRPRAPARRRPPRPRPLRRFRRALAPRPTPNRSRDDRAARAERARSSPNAWSRANTPRRMPGRWCRST